MSTSVDRSNERGPSSEGREEADPWHIRRFQRLIYEDFAARYASSRGSATHKPEEDLSLEPNCTCSAAQAVDGTGSPISVQVDSEEYRLSPSSGNPDLYYSLTVWPVSHPTYGALETVANRLGLDLQSTVIEEADKRPKLLDAESAILPQLRLAGIQCTKHNQIDLYPTIWIDCGSERIRNAIEVALRTKSTLSWVASEDVIVQKGLVLSARAHSPTCTSLDSSSLKSLNFDGGVEFGNGYRLHLHLEDPHASNSPCGLRVCATVTCGGAIVDSKISRLGGLLLLGGTRPFACSTAHGIMGMWPMTDHGSKNDSKSPPSPRHVNGTETGESSGDPVPSSDSVAATDESSRSTDSWIPVPSLLALDFIRPAKVVNDRLRVHIEASPRPHDFALLDLGTELSASLKNTYLIDCKRETITGHYDDVSLPTAAGQAKVLCGRGNTMLGTILPFDDTIFMRGVMFKTRRVIVEQPLGKLQLNSHMTKKVYNFGIASNSVVTVPGCSGSWVVSGPFLCGTIMSCYESEPIAHMATAARFLRAIEEDRVGEGLSVSLPKYGTGEAHELVQGPPGREHSLESTTPTGITTPPLTNPRISSSQVSIMGWTPDRVRDLLNISIQEAARLAGRPLGLAETRHEPQRDDESSPSDAHDVLVVCFRGKEHPIHFPQHDIADGKVKVRNLIRPVARAVSLSGRESRALRFFHSGRQLANLFAPLRDYGVQSNGVLVAILPCARKRGRWFLWHRRKRERI